MRDHFLQLAEHGQWANKRLYDAAAELDDEQRNRDVGAYFKSLHGTLAHILVADQIWMSRLNHEPQPFDLLNTHLWPDFETLRQAREDQDQRAYSYISALSDDRITAGFDYKDMSGTDRHLPVRVILTHLFNHATHHRGQAHHILKQLGMDEPPAMDLPYFALDLL